MRLAGLQALIGALALHIAITVAWYATLPHAPPFSTLVPWAGLFLCGFVLGVLEVPVIIAYAVALGVLMPLSTSVVHLVFASSGVVEDARTPSAAFLFGAMLVPIGIALSCAGALSGAWLKKRR